MKNIEMLKTTLISLMSEVNSGNEVSKIQFNQQKKSTQNMSFSGCNGRIWIQPFNQAYDVSLSGASLEKELTSEFNKLFNNEFAGYKQSNSNEGVYKQPYWRTSDFALVKAAVLKYAKTTK